jgi:rare lipoprotein A (peptidoglycan hydrolase)
MQIRFEDKPEPEAFALEAEAVRDAPEGADGLWAAVAGLPRPERALVVNASNGRKVVVALFKAPRGTATPIRISNAAADALRMGDAPAEVRVTALRREAKVRTTGSRF